MKHIIFSLLISIFLIPGSAIAQDNEGHPVALVELFTSQGCSSCPPADKFLGDLTKRDDVLALSFHVDYWNYIGWEDPFSDPVYTERQRTYARQLKLRYVYTPQMVVQGSFETTGSKRREIADFIDEAKSLPRIAIKLSTTSNAILSINIDGRKADQSILSEQPFEIWAAVYDKYHSTPVKRGENTGRIMENYNVVRTLQKIGQWNGEPETYNVSLSDLTKLGGDACAVFIQSVKSGRILGATTLDL